MPLSEVEKAICKVVAQRLVEHVDFTPRRVLLKEFRSAAPEALSTLVSSSILKTLGGNPEIYLPSTLTFEFCGDRELLGVARLSTQVVLQASRGLFERELERGDQRQYSPADIEKEVMALGLQGQRVKIGLGLYLAEEFGVFPSIQKNHPGLEIVGVQIGERILTMRDIESAWDQHIRQIAPNLYSELRGGLGESIAASVDHSTDSSTMQTKDANVESRLGESADPISRVTSGITEGMATDITKRGIEAAVRALSDKPSLIDLLDYRDYAKALIDLIQNPKTQMPLTIAIDGAWGSGKTTLMEMMKGGLDGQKKDGDGRLNAHTVWFNAWKYDREDSLWAALALEILAQVRKQLTMRQRGWLWIRLNWKRFDWQELLKAIGKSIILPGLAVLTALGAMKFWSTWVGSGLDLSKWSSVAIGSGALGFLSLFAKKFQDRVIAPFDLKLPEYVRTPDYKKRMGFLHEFETDFKFVVDAVTSSGKLSLVVFIDDLDRCEPAKPVEVIEAINHLLDADSCVFVIGMDARTVAASVQAKYSQLLDSAFVEQGGAELSLGYRFLEKIIQIPFRLPKASRLLLNKFVETSLKGKATEPAPPRTGVAEAERLIGEAEGRGESLEGAVASVAKGHADITPEVLNEAKHNIFARTFDDDPEVLKAICDVVPLLEFNARKVKRFINLFRLNVLIANRRGLFEQGIIELSQLAKWLTIVVRWPDFVDLAPDRGFLETLWDAHELHVKSLGTTNPSDTNAARTLLASYLEDPRIRRFIGAHELLKMLASLGNRNSGIGAAAKSLRPYIELSGVTGPLGS